MTKKGLLIGINKYHDAPLSCCINDVNAMNELLSKNSNGDRNFHNRELLDSEATKVKIRKGIKDLFSGEVDVALLYFSGHGFDDENDGVIVSYDYEEDDWGIKMSEILEIANKSQARHKIIILDCCHSGFMGNHGIIGDTSFLGNGVVILTACKKDQSSIEVNGHGVFTNLLLEAIGGGAADILGNVTPGSIYSYIDQALGPWEQRPLFKANISSFICLRNTQPRIVVDEIRKIAVFFFFFYSVFKLDPSFEKTNIKNGKHRNLYPYANSENVEIFTLLQKYNRNGLVVPYDSSDMYFAAMDSKGCVLTPLGKHYFKMVKEEII